MRLRQPFPLHSLLSRTTWACKHLIFSALVNAVPCQLQNIKGFVYLQLDLNLCQISDRWLDCYWATAAVCL